MNARRIVVLALFALAAGVLVVSVAPSVVPGLFVGEPGAYNRTTVAVSDANGTQLATVDVRVADTDEKRYVGLSETDDLSMGEGMLFVHESEGTQAYVMRNMSFPLDIVFVEADGTIGRIVHASVDGENAPYRARAKYVLEVSRGWANATGVTVGDRVAVPEDVR
jgi:uncharacterized membrane protein (UPF0127 family)